MLNHQMARARVVEHTARAEGLATDRQLLASARPERRPALHSRRSHPVSVHDAGRAMNA